MKRKDDPNIKANHYTTAETYIDPNDGNTKQFTIIDHDIKTKVYIPMSEEEKQKLKEDIDTYNRENLEQVLALPAVNAVMNEDPFIDIHLYNEFVTRKPEGMVWDEKFLRETAKVNPELITRLRQRVWRHTVPEQYWFEELTHEEMINGKWRVWAGLD